MTLFRALTPAFSVAPQIAPADVPAAAAAGFRLIVNNRPDGEEPGQVGGAEIAAAAEAAGLSYVAIPVSPGGFSPAQVEALTAAVDGAGGPVLAFCRSGTRSTMLWALAEARRGTDPAELVAVAARQGYDLAPLRPLLESLRRG